MARFINCSATSALDLPKISVSMSLSRKSATFLLVVIPIFTVCKVDGLGKTSIYCINIQ